MDRRNWVRLVVLSAAVTAGAVVITPGVAQAAISPHVEEWLDDQYGVGGWQDAGCDPGPPHYHDILDTSELPVRLGRVIQNSSGWVFEEYPSGDTTSIPNP